MKWCAQENLPWIKHNINVHNPKTKDTLSMIPYYALIKYKTRKSKFQIASEI